MIDHNRYNAFFLIIAEWTAEFKSGLITQKQYKGQLQNLYIRLRDEFDDDILKEMFITARKFTTEKKQTA